MSILAAKISFLLALTLTVAGCVTTNTSGYGNFVESKTIDQTMLAKNALETLKSIYPPALTKFQMQHAHTDVFGVTLVNGLRDHGYSLMEYKPGESAVKPGCGFKPEAPLIQAKEQPEMLPVCYILDEANNVFRLTLLVGAESLTRPYVERESEPQPVGYWVRKRTKEAKPHEQ
jgi:hypothetical protein